MVTKPGKRSCKKDFRTTQKNCLPGILKGRVVEILNIVIQVRDIPEQSWLFGIGGAPLFQQKNILKSLTGKENKGVQKFS